MMIKSTPSKRYPPSDCVGENDNPEGEGKNECVERGENFGLIGVVIHRGVQGGILRRETEPALYRDGVGK